MRVPDDVICLVCRKIFCCTECRFKHEIKSHAIAVQKPLVLSNDGADDQSVKGSVAVHSTTIYLFCPICASKPLLLKEAMYSEMLDHIKENHLPLNCQKCSKIYTNVEDLKEFSKCVQAEISYMKGKPETDVALKDQQMSKCSGTTMHSTIATQTSPMPAPCNYNTESHITPVSMLNMYVKSRKVTHEEFITDSVSSIRNISSISNASDSRSIGVLMDASKGKVVRSTSTPVQAEFVFAKPKEHVFSGSTVQVSSIYSASESEGGGSVPAPYPVGTPSQRSADVNRYRKVVGRSKVSAITPLRHVMSKSIQKAIAEHGLAGHVRDPHLRRKMFESSDSSLETKSIEQQGPNITHKINNSSPLDLRLSPALRRTQSESAKFVTRNHDQVNVPQTRQKVLLSSKKTTTESIVITRMHKVSNAESSTNDTDKGENVNISTTKSSSSLGSSNPSINSICSDASSIYQTCRSVEIITSTEMNEVEVHRNDCYSSEQTFEKLVSGGQLSVETNHLAPITPRTRIKEAVIKKKHILFETPTVEEVNSSEIYFTPQSSPEPKSTDTQEEVVDRKTADPAKFHRLSSQYRRPSLSDYYIENIGDEKTKTDSSEDDEVFESKKDLNKQVAEEPQSGSLWTLMASVIRLPSLAAAQGSPPVGEFANSLIRRCSSIAGSIVRRKPAVEDEQLPPLKRKRTYTADYSSAYFSSNDLLTDTSTNSSDSSCKRFRIQGRKPIERMRLNSQFS